MRLKSNVLRSVLSLIISSWILGWTWAVGYFDWTDFNKAVAFFFFFTVEVFLLDLGYRWIRPKTDLSISAGLGILMFCTFLFTSVGTIVISAYRPDALFPTIWRTLNGVEESELRPFSWAIITGIFHALILGLMGMTVLIWRRPVKN